MVGVGKGLDQYASLCSQAVSPRCIGFSWCLGFLHLELRRMTAVLRANGASALSAPVWSHNISREMYELRTQAKAWEDESAWRGFVQATPHAQTMKLIAAHIGTTSFIRSRVKGSEVPPDWNDALGRWAQS
jgi:hypothetical protein